MAVSATLTRLATHYWRPDFEPNQIKYMMVDYLNDLSAYSPADVEASCVSFRRNPENKFYPRIGELLAILNPKRDPSDRPSHLRKFSSSEYDTPRYNLKSVAEVLRSTGYEKAANAWEERDSTIPKHK